MAARNRRRDSSGHVDPYYQRRRRYEAALRPLGLWEAFARLPRRVQELFWKRKSPDPVLEFDASFPDGRDDRPLRMAVESAFRHAVIDVNGAPLVVRDFFSVITGLKLAVQHTRETSTFPEVVIEFLRAAGPCLDRCFKDQLPESLISLARAVDHALAAHTHLDSRLLTTMFHSDRAVTGKVGVRLTVSAAEPETRRVEIDGVQRPVYRVANTWGGMGVRWLSWDGQQLDRPGSDEQYPVYVQSHALRQLRQRVNLPPAAPYLEGWLAESLGNPRIVQRQGADLLVEYRLKDYRMGYLVVTPVDGVVVVRTFKFLTMEQTPEARMLEQRLRLTRRDVDWLSLNELAAFTQTDLRQDPVLRPLLEECGCGHLFALDEEDYAPEPKSYAAEVRRYLCIAT